MRWRRPLVVVVALLAACSIHNRMFHLNRYASEARRLEAQGRQFEANDYWGRASVKAESVLVHYPTGANAAQAHAIRGEAMAALGQCADAQQSLEVALATLDDAADREYAAIALARCQLQAGDPAGALATVQPITTSHDDVRQREARLLAGGALRRQGEDASALVLLEGLPGREARFERAIAEVGAGQGTAGLTIDSLVRMRDSTMAWDSLLAAVGTRDPRLASQLVDQLRRDSLLGPVDLPNVLHADMERLEQLDPAAAAARRDELMRMAPGSDAALRARLEVVRAALQGAHGLGALTPIRDTLEALRALQGEPAGALARAIDQVGMLVDSASAGAAQGDLRLFLAAESARDQLQAPLLADSLFRAIATDWPGSPYAGKAWLAARQLSGDTTAIDPRFEDSPYLRVLRGADDTVYAHLEDSLATFAQSLAAAPGPASPSPAARQQDRRVPRAQVRPSRDSAPGSRQQPGARTPSATRRAAGVEP